MQRRLTVSYVHSPDGRVVSRTGTVRTDSGAEVPISSSEIDVWLDNYEAGVIPAGPAGGALSLLLKGLMALPEPGLEDVCVECWISPGIRWAAGAVNWGMSVVRNSGGQCKNAGTPSDSGISFQTGHYAPRLREGGLNVPAVEARVAEEVEKLRAEMIPNQRVIRQITIDGVLVEFRAFMRSDGQINVGTIFPVH